MDIKGITLKEYVYVSNEELEEVSDKIMRVKIALRKYFNMKEKDIHKELLEKYKLPLFEDEKYYCQSNVNNLDLSNFNLTNSLHILNHRCQIYTISLHKSHAIRLPCINISSRARSHLTGKQ